MSGSISFGAFLLCTKKKEIVQRQNGKICDNKHITQRLSDEFCSKCGLVLSKNIESVTEKISHRWHLPENVIGLRHINLEGSRLYDDYDIFIEDPPDTYDPKKNPYGESFYETLVPFNTESDEVFVEPPSREEFMRRFQEKYRNEMKELASLYEKVELKAGLLYEYNG